MRGTTSARFGGLVVGGHDHGLMPIAVRRWEATGRAARASVAGSVGTWERCPAAQPSDPGGPGRRGYRGRSALDCGRSMTAPAHRPRVAFLGYAHDARGGIAQFGRRLAETVGERADVRLVGYRKLYPCFTRPGRQRPTPAPRACGSRRSRSSCPGTRAPGARPRRHLPAFGADLLVVQWWSPLFGPSIRAILRRARRAGTRTLSCATTTARTSRCRSRARSPAARSPRPTCSPRSPQPVADGVRALVPAATCSSRPLPQALIARTAADANHWDARLGAPAAHDDPVLRERARLQGPGGPRGGAAARARAGRRAARRRRHVHGADGALRRAGARARRRARTSRSSPTTSRTSTCPACSRARTSSRCPTARAGSGVLGEAAGRPSPSSPPRRAAPGWWADRGMLVPPRDPPALADGLVRALREIRPRRRPVDDGAWTRWRDFVLANARDGGMSARRHQLIAAARRLGLEDALRDVDALRSSDGAPRPARHARAPPPMALTLAEDACCVDVGANVGAVLRHMVEFAPRGRHVAFEPLPELAALLAARVPRRRRAQRRGLRPRRRGDLLPRPRPRHAQLASARSTRGGAARADHRRRRRRSTPRCRTDLVAGADQDRRRGRRGAGAPRRRGDARAPPADRRVRARQAARATSARRRRRSSSCSRPRDCASSTSTAVGPYDAAALERAVDAGRIWTFVAHP